MCVRRIALAAVGIMQGLSSFQKEAIVAVGDFGEVGLWAGSSLVNWIALRSLTGSLLVEQVPGHKQMRRLTPLGRKVRSLIKRS